MERAHRLGLGVRVVVHSEGDPSAWGVVTMQSSVGAVEATDGEADVAAETRAVQSATQVRLPGHPADFLSPLAYCLRLAKSENLQKGTWPGSKEKRIGLIGPFSCGLWQTQTRVTGAVAYAILVSVLEVRVLGILV